MPAKPPSQLAPSTSLLQTTLAKLRDAGQTNREIGTYFEQLTACYFRHEPKFRDTYSKVEHYADSAATTSLSRRRL